MTKNKNNLKIIPQKEGKLAIVSAITYTDVELQINSIIKDNKGK